jgi:hypothetical protein
MNPEIFLTMQQENWQQAPIYLALTLFRLLATVQNRETE